ncbi:PREDICTED: chorion class A protein L11-like, partial [Rhagoletis zephyria]|uniref:chorion class A protein L11-like n=1 Tax=Rhagoletis zephyria TaxID=28612 RepID=UPI0008113FA8
MKFFIIAALISLAVANPALLVGHGGLGGYGLGGGLGGYGNGLLLDGGLGLAGHGAAPAGLGGHGFGHGGHFSPMPVQTIQLVPVPQPVPVAQPIPVDKPYAVPIDK